MAYEELCMYCFEDRQGQVICPHCGRDSRAAVPQIQMLPGSLVYHERFLVGRALGQDATGIVYSAYDTKRENKMRLREYLPRDCSERLNDGTVVPIAGLEDQFEKGMRKLRASVEGVEDPKKRHFYFEENGTAYIAQRKGAAAAAVVPGKHRDEDEGGRSAKQLGIIIGVAAAVVVIAAIVIISLVNGALNSADDIVTDPTLSPSSSASLWAPEVTASPTPYVAPTFAALVDPEQSWMDYTYSGDVNQDFDKQQSQAATAKPTLKPESSEYTETISSKSPPEQITRLQQRLAQLGWLAGENINGKYDSATKQAVKDFQNYVNSAIRPAEKLSVDGIAGPKTLQWLFASDVVMPTPTPTPVVTPDPDDQLTVDKNSSKNDIKAVQRKLITLGLMDEGSDDGVYGTTTTAAVKKFQQRVNQLQGYNALEITGVVDPLSMAYLNYYVEWWENLQQTTPTPAPVLPTMPTITATPVPTVEPTDIPDAPEDNLVIDKNSPKESIKAVQEMLIYAGLLPNGSADGIYGSGTTNAVIQFQIWVNDQKGPGTVPVTGTVDSRTLNYLEEVFDLGITVVKPTEKPTSAPQQPTQKPTDRPTTKPTDRPTDRPTNVPTAEPTEIPDIPDNNFFVGPDSEKESIQYVQSMLIEIGLLADGSDDGVYGNGTTNAVKKFQQYVNSVQPGTLPEDGMCDTMTLSYMEEFVSRGMTVPSEQSTAEPTPTEAPVVTEAPAASVDVSIDVSGADVVEGVYVVTDDVISFNWSASGDCLYYIYVFDGNGNSIYSNESTDRTTGQFGASELTPGMLYTLQIGALPAGGDESSMTWTEVMFGVPNVTVTEAPVVTEAPTEAPVVTEAPTEVPTEAPTEAPGVIESLAVAINGSSSGFVEVSDGVVTFEWAATGDVDAYAVRITDGAGNVVLTVDETTETTGTINADSLVPGEVYTCTVGARPTNGGEVAWVQIQFGKPAPVVTEAPTEAPTEVPTEAPTEAPVIEISTPKVSIDHPDFNRDEVMNVTDPMVTFTWQGDENVQGYMLYMTNPAGDRLDLENTTDTRVTVDVSSYPANQYRLYVGAVPVNAQSEEDVVWGYITFAIPAAE